MASRPTGNKPKPAAAAVADAPSPDARAADPARAPDPDGRKVADGKIAIELQHARGQHLRWILIGGIVGTLFVIGLGTLGKALGVFLLGIAAWSVYQFIRTLLHPPGTLVIAPDVVELPRGVCRGEPSKIRRGEVTSAYFLRRAVPWTQAAPVLVIEAGGRAFSYPRDWFVEEGDQRRILDALVP